MIIITVKVIIINYNIDFYVNIIITVIITSINNMIYLVPVFPTYLKKIRLPTQVTNTEARITTALDLIIISLGEVTPYIGKP